MGLLKERGLTVPEHAIYGSLEEGLGDGILLHRVHCNTLIFIRI
jgi:hypothetical protein